MATFHWGGGGNLLTLTFTFVHSHHVNLQVIKCENTLTFTAKHFCVLMFKVPFW